MSIATSSYQELLVMKADLDRQIEESRLAELEGAISKARALVQDFALTADDVFPKATQRRAVKAVLPKYRDPVSGGTWTGRGKPPLWIKNAPDRMVFAIQSS